MSILLSLDDRPDGRQDIRALEEKEVMLRGGEVDVAGEVFEEFGAVLGEPGQDTEISLLQIFVWVEGGEN